MDCQFSSLIHLFRLSLRNKIEKNMNVNISALNEALDFINENSETEYCKDFIIHVNTKDKARRGREMKLDISTSCCKNNTNKDREFHLTIERRYEENENIKATQLYQHLTIPGDEWRRNFKAKITHTHKVAHRCEYNIVNVSCQSVTMKDIKKVILKILRFIYSDDKFRELSVAMLDWDEHKERRFKPSSRWNSEIGSITKPEFCLN